MTERNMIREGFIFNTATSPTNPTFSGTQTLNEQQLTALADENISVVAVTVSATENINITADMGARWKLDRLELYTNDPSNANIDMQISDNGVDYFPVTMTGSPNLYVGDIPDSTVSGAPRYIRYRHAAASALEVYEWKALNDDTIVDFGLDGTQTSVEIADAPIGRTSDTVQNLKLFNRFHKPGSAFVYIENTNNAADDLFEIATTANGPWYGRHVAESLQPDNTPWTSGTFNGTTEVTASGYYMNWFYWQSQMGWTSTGMNFISYTSDPSVGGGGSINWQTTTTTPSYRSESDYTEGLSKWQTVTAGVGNINNPHIRSVLIDTNLYDRIRLRLKGSPLVPGDIIEGPRMRWRWIDDANPADPFPIENSTLSQFPFNNFTGDVQDFIFDVGNITTWSGAPYNYIRGLEFSPFITATGIGNIWDLYEIEVYGSDGRSKVILDRQPTQSGIRPELVDSGMTADTTGPSAWLIMNTRITQPCIITKVMMFGYNPGVNANGGIFLYRETPESGNFKFPGKVPVLNTNPTPNDPGEAAGDNFEVKGTCQFRSMTGSLLANTENWVFWKAEPGDLLGVSREQQTTAFGPAYKAATSAGPAAYKSDIVSGWNNSTVNMESNAVCESDLNNQDSWTRVYDVLYQVWCNTVPLGNYLATGTYTTPIFDGGTQPSLVSSSFIAFEPGDSSVDTNTSVAFKTIRARASDRPPLSVPDRGSVFNYDNFIWGRGVGDRYPTGQNSTAAGTLPVRKWINEDTPDPSGNDWQINRINGFVTNREFPSGGNAVKNLAGAMMYHPVKDELWVMNVLTSGIAPSDIRPVWDVYNPDSLDYIRTDHMKGQLNYTYRSDLTSFPEIFEPVGFIYDSAYDEIYIIQREDSFYIGTVTYYAVVMDTEGNFLRCSWRASQVGGTVTRWHQMSSIAFDNSYFYYLTTNNGGTNDGSIGDILGIAKRGDLEAGDYTQVSEIATVDLSSIPGLTGATGNPITQQCIFNTEDGLLYLFFGNPVNSGDDIRFRSPEMYALRISIDSNDVYQSAVKVPLVDPRGISTQEGVRLAELGQRRDGYTGDWAGPSGNNDDTDLIQNRNLNFLSASCFDTSRQVFNIISSHRAEQWDDWDIRENYRRTNNYLYDKKTIQMFFSCNAGTASGVDVSTPINPRGHDPYWGSLSGTLGWNSLQQNSILFPTGRYAQLEYTLNSSSDFSTSPQLITSQLDQGIRIGDIPASGTTDLWLRTDIPEDQPIGDLTSGLKVFWELPE